MTYRNLDIQFFFGTEYPSLGIPLSILSLSSEIAGRVLRMCTRTQINVGGSLTHTAGAGGPGGGGKHGAAFAHISTDRQSNRVTYSNYKFDATFDSMFPRVPLIAQYVLSFLSHARSVDRENNHYERIALHRSRSASPAAVLFSKSPTPSPSPSPPPLSPSPTSIYSNACSVLRGALRNALQLSTTPSVPRRLMRVKVGSTHQGQVRVVEEAPADTEESRRLEIVRAECAALLSHLSACKDGELQKFYAEGVAAANRSLEKLARF